MLNRVGLFVLCICCVGCNTGMINMPDNFVYVPLNAHGYDIATWQKISDDSTPIRIYIEGDGRAFDAYGAPTRNPTPHSDVVRKMAMRDAFPNVVYIARPCQYIMSDICSVSDWTSGRFSPQIISAMSDAIGQIAENRPVILIGYSGGAMLSGLIIAQNTDLNISQWITVAGVLNHSDWSNYFGDTALSDSANLNTLPRISQCHFAAESDNVVPYMLSKKWTHDNVTVIPKTRHNDLRDFVPNCANKN